jgi:restriction system protein
MKEDLSNLPKTKKAGVKALSEAFRILKEEGGQLPGREVINQIRENISFDDYEREILEKTGNVRWEAILTFYTVDCVKAGFLRKQNGQWFLTKEGEEAYDKLSKTELLEQAKKGYNQWYKSHKVSENESEPEKVLEEDDSEEAQLANLQNLEDRAFQDIMDFINGKNPYDFQDLVAGLLNAMGYYTPFVSPKGKDGGVDIIAYQDPLGAKQPRIRVQVKHQPNVTQSVTEIRNLTGILNRDTEIGLFVTSGTFSKDAENFARENQLHVKLIDGNHFIDLWKQFYPHMTDSVKSLMPLYPIYFLSND